MKKLTIISAAALSVFALASCEREKGFEPATVLDSEITVTATRDASTRSSLEVDETSGTPVYNVLWDAPDQILVTFPGAEPGVFASENEAPVAEADFTGHLPSTDGDASVLYGLYPAEEGNCVDAKGNFQFAFHDKQTAVAGSFDPAALPAGAVSDPGSTNLQFSNVCGLLKITVALPDISVIKLHPIKAALAPTRVDADATIPGGTLLVDFSGNEPELLSGTENLDTVTLLPPDGEEFFDPAETYYIVVPPCTLDGGAYFTLTRPAGDDDFVVSTDPVSVVRSKVHEVVTPLGDEEETFAGYFVKTTSDNFVDGGKYLIVYEGDDSHDAVAFDGSLSTLDAVENHIVVTIADGEVVADADNIEPLEAALFTITGRSGAITVQNASDVYIGQTSYGNGLKSSDTVADGYYHAIDFDETDNVLLQVKLEGGTVTLKYNYADNQLRFRYYKSGQQPIALYRYTLYEPAAPAGSEKAEAGIAFDVTNLTATVGEAFTAPTLSNPNGLAVTYESDNPDVAEVDEQTGEVTINGAGTVAIIAITQETDEFEAGKAFYIIKVTDPTVSLPSTIAGIIAAIPETATGNKTAVEFEANLASPAVVSYVNGKNAYIQDETGAILLYLTDHGLTAGDAITGKLSIKAYWYNGIPEMVAVGSEYEKTSGTAPSPKEITIADLLENYDANLLRLVKLSGVTVTDGIADGDRNGKIVQGGAEVAVYAQLSNKGLELAEGDTGDLVTIPGYYNTNKQVYLWDNDWFTKKESPAVATGITIDGDMSDWASVEGVSTPSNICKEMKVTNDDENFYFYLASEPGPRGSTLWGESAGYYYLDFDLDNDATTGDDEGSRKGFEAYTYLYLFGGSADSPYIVESPKGTSSHGVKTSGIVAKGVISSELIEIELSIPFANFDAAPVAGQTIRVLSWRSKDGSVIEQTYTVKLKISENTGSEITA